MSDNLIINGDFSAGIGATATSVAGQPLAGVSLVPGWEVTTHSTDSSGDVDFNVYTLDQAVYEGLTAEPPASIAGRGVFQIAADDYLGAEDNFVRLDHYIAGAAGALSGRYAEISFAVHAAQRGIIRFSIPAQAHYDEGSSAELEACPETDVNLEPGWNFIRKQFLVPTFPVLEEDVDEVIVPHYVTSNFLVFKLYADLQGSKVSLAQTDSVAIADVVLTEVVTNNTKFSPVQALEREQSAIRRLTTYTDEESAVTPDDEYILLDGVVTATLPLLTTVPVGKELLIKSLSGTPAVEAAGADTIDGEIGITDLSTYQFQCARIVAGSDEWHIIGGAISAAP